MRSVIFTCLLFISSSLSFAQQVQLATVYDDENVSDYLVSEKLDGVRAIWDGQHLTTRSGQPITTPTWFVDGWPNVWLDGELWAGRQHFSFVQQTVLDQVPDEKMWRKIRYMVFDAPNQSETFEKRAMYYQMLLSSMNLPYIRPIHQYQLSSTEALYQLLEQTVTNGGEGLMLHRRNAYFINGRSDALLKLKQFQDAEAKVVAHIPGKGKYANSLGSLEVMLANGQRFRIGTGFTDAQRENPPKIGEYITFRYQGLTASGLPRFASFIRVRKDDFEFAMPH